MKADLYILDDDDTPVPATTSEYNRWEESIPPDERTALGKRIRSETVGTVSIVTVFVANGCGFHGRKPLVFLTMVHGPGTWINRCYSSHRACLSGHRDAVAKARRAAGKPPCTVGVDCADSEKAAGSQQMTNRAVDGPDGSA